jgi:acyl-CoA thioesterase-1
LFLGNSLTAGLGVSEDQAFPALIQQKIDSAGLRYGVVNAGVSGETSAGGLRRIDWLLRQRVDVLVLELGANDGLRGQDVDSMAANLQAIIDKTRAAYPDVRIVIAGMQAPPNMGPSYTRRFRAVFPRLARENDATLIPFLLADVAAVDTLNQPDGIHPTAQGHRIIAETVWKVLEQVLEGGKGGKGGKGGQGG